MSIYAGPIWELTIDFKVVSNVKYVEGRFQVDVYAMIVPAHIGKPDGGDQEDPYKDFLPPPVSDEDEEKCINRAVVILAQGFGDIKDKQQYRKPLLVFSGNQYNQMPFDEVMCEIRQALQERFTEVFQKDIIVL